VAMADDFVPMIGGCQCGTVRYQVTAPPVQTSVCHCTDCQKQSGSAFGMAVIVFEQDFRLVEGELHTFSGTADSGRRKFGAFCSSCGTRIYHQSALRPGRISVKAGTLDDTAGLKPDVHIWAASKQPWVAIPDGVERHDGNPT